MSSGLWLDVLTRDLPAEDATTMPRPANGTTVALIALCALLAGCDGKFIWFEQPPKSPAITSTSEHASPAIRDTIGEATWLEGMRRMRVRGYGLVVGLGENGSADCPRTIRERLVQDMLKRPELARSTERIDPDRLIDSKATAVVIVQAEIPAAAPAKTSFDVTVEAIPGSQTRSLEGGRLFTCDLSYDREVAPGAALAGKALASACGPIFLNPFAKDDNAGTQVNRRRGYILGGGRSFEDRRLRLVLLRPSYQQVTAMAERINARFPAPDKLADAASQSQISLRIPREWQRDPARFLAVVQHLYIPSRTGFADERAAALLEELKRPDAPHMDVALALEGIGRNVIPRLGPLYSDARPHVSYYAALAGLRLGDDAAVHVMQIHALDAHGRYRLDAIEALGAADDVPRAALPLRQCLSDADPRVQVAAYEALRRRGDVSIQSSVIAGDNFVLDRVEAANAHLVYAKRSDQRRIAVIGDGVQFSPPVFYRQSDGLLTLSAGDADSELTVLRRGYASGGMAPPAHVALELGEALAWLGADPRPGAKGTVSGLGVDDTTLVQMLFELCGSHSINARFMLEQHGATTELFGPLGETGRPESEL